jgi:hypothetical protein
MGYVERYARKTGPPSAVVCQKLPKNNGNAAAAQSEGTEGFQPPTTSIRSKSTVDLQQQQQQQLMAHCGFWPCLFVAAASLVTMKAKYSRSAILETLHQPTRKQVNRTKRRRK